MGDSIYGYTMLMIKVEEGNLREVQATRSKYPNEDVNAQNKVGQTALTIAAKSGFYSIADYLIRQGADINITNKSGQTPIFLACWYNHADLIQLFLDFDADVNIPDSRGWTPIMAACHNNNLDIVKLLLKVHPDVRSFDCFGKRARERAKDPKIIKLITKLEKKQDEVEDMLHDALPTRCRTKSRSKSMVRRKLSRSKSRPKSKTPKNFRFGSPEKAFVSPEKSPERGLNSQNSLSEVSPLRTCPQFIHGIEIFKPNDKVVKYKSLRAKDSKKIFSSDNDVLKIQRKPSLNMEAKFNITSTPKSGYGSVGETFRNLRTPPTTDSKTRNSVFSFPTTAEKQNAMYIEENELGDPGSFGLQDLGRDGSDSFYDSMRTFRKAREEIAVLMNKAKEMPSTLKSFGSLGSTVGSELRSVPPSNSKFKETGSLEFLSMRSEDDGNNALNEEAKELFILFIKHLSDQINSLLDKKVADAYNQEMLRNGRLSDKKFQRIIMEKGTEISDRTISSFRNLVKELMNSLSDKNLIETIRKGTEALIQTITSGAEANLYDHLVQNLDGSENGSNKNPWLKAPKTPSKNQRYLDDDHGDLLEGFKQEAIKELNEIFNTVDRSLALKPAKEKARFAEIVRDFILEDLRQLKYNLEKLAERNLSSSELDFELSQRRLSKASSLNLNHKSTQTNPPIHHQRSAQVLMHSSTSTNVDETFENEKVNQKATQNKVYKDSRIPSKEIETKSDDPALDVRNIIVYPEPKNLNLKNWKSLKLPAKIDASEEISNCPAKPYNSLKIEQPKKFSRNQELNQMFERSLTDALDGHKNDNQALKQKDSFEVDEADSVSKKWDSLENSWQKKSRREITFGQDVNKEIKEMKNEISDGNRKDNSGLINAFRELKKTVKMREAPQQMLKINLSEFPNNKVGEYIDKTARFGENEAKEQANDKIPIEKREKNSNSISNTGHENDNLKKEAKQPDFSHPALPQNVIPNKRAQAGKIVSNRDRKDTQNSEKKVGFDRKPNDQDIVKIDETKVREVQDAASEKAQTEDQTKEEKTVCQNNNEVDEKSSVNDRKADDNTQGKKEERLMFEEDNQEVNLKKLESETSIKGDPENIESPTKEADSDRQIHSKTELLDEAEEKSDKIEANAHTAIQDEDFKIQLEENRKDNEISNFENKILCNHENKVSEKSVEEESRDKISYEFNGLNSRDMTERTEQEEENLSQGISSKNKIEANIERESSHQDIHQEVPEPNLNKEGEASNKLEEADDNDQDAFKTINNEEESVHEHEKIDKKETSEDALVDDSGRQDVGGLDRQNDEACHEEEFKEKSEASQSNAEEEIKDREPVEMMNDLDSRDMTERLEQEEETQNQEVSTKNKIETNIQGESFDQDINGEMTESNINKKVEEINQSIDKTREEHNDQDALKITNTKEESVNQCEFENQKEVVPDTLVDDSGHQDAETLDRQNDEACHEEGFKEKSEVDDIIREEEEQEKDGPSDVEENTEENNDRQFDEKLQDKEEERSDKKSQSNAEEEIKDREPVEVMDDLDSRDMTERLEQEEEETQNQEISTKNKIETNIQGESFDQDIHQEVPEPNLNKEGETTNKPGEDNDDDQGALKTLNTEEESANEQEIMDKKETSEDALVDDSGRQDVGGLDRQNDEACHEEEFKEKSEVDDIIREGEEKEKDGPSDVEENTEENNDRQFDEKLQDKEEERSDKKSQSNAEEEIKDREPVEVMDDLDSRDMTERLEQEEEETQNQEISTKNKIETNIQGESFDQDIHQEVPEPNLNKEGETINKPGEATNDDQGALKTLNTEEESANEQKIMDKKETSEGALDDDSGHQDVGTLDRQNDEACHEEEFKEKSKVDDIIREGEEQEKDGPSDVEQNTEENNDEELDGKSIDRKEEHPGRQSQIRVDEEKDVGESINPSGKLEQQKENDSLQQVVSEIKEQNSVKLTEKQEIQKLQEDEGVNNEKDIPVDGFNGDKKASIQDQNQKGENDSEDVEELINEEYGSEDSGDKNVYQNLMPELRTQQDLHKIEEEDEEDEDDQQIEGKKITENSSSIVIFDANEADKINNCKEEFEKSSPSQKLCSEDISEDYQKNNMLGQENRQNTENSDQELRTLEPDLKEKTELQEQVTDENKLGSSNQKEDQNFVNKINDIDESEKLEEEEPGQDNLPLDEKSLGEDVPAKVQKEKSDLKCMDEVVEDQKENLMEQILNESEKLKQEGQEVEEEKPDNPQSDKIEPGSDFEITLDKDKKEIQKIGEEQEKDRVLEIDTQQIKENKQEKIETSVSNIDIESDNTATKLNDILGKSGVTEEHIEQINKMTEERHPPTQQEEIPEIIQKDKTQEETQDNKPLSIQGVENDRHHEQYENEEQIEVTDETLLDIKKPEKVEIEKKQSENMTNELKRTHLEPSTADRNIVDETQVDDNYKKQEGTQKQKHLDTNKVQEISNLSNESDHPNEVLNKGEQAPSSAFEENIQNQNTKLIQGFEKINQKETNKVLSEDSLGAARNIEHKYGKEMASPNLASARFDKTLIQNQEDMKLEEKEDKDLSINYRSTVHSFTPVKPFYVQPFQITEAADSSSSSDEENDFDNIFKEMQSIVIKDPARSLISNDKQEKSRKHSNKEFVQETSNQYDYASPSVKIEPVGSQRAILKENLVIRNVRSFTTSLRPFIPVPTPSRFVKKINQTLIDNIPHSEDFHSPGRKSNTRSLPTKTIQKEWVETYFISNEIDVKAPDNMK